MIDTLTHFRRWTHSLIFTILHLHVFLKSMHLDTQLYSHELRRNWRWSWRIVGLASPSSSGRTRVQSSSLWVETTLSWFEYFSFV